MILQKIIKELLNNTISVFRTVEKNDLWIKMEWDDYWRKMNLAVGTPNALTNFLG